MADPSPSSRAKPTDVRKSPPESIRTFYKTYQRIDVTSLSSDHAVLDFSRGIGAEQRDCLNIVNHVDHHKLRLACARFGGHGVGQLAMLNLDVPVYESLDVPGEPWEVGNLPSCVS